MVSPYYVAYQCFTDVLHVCLPTNSYLFLLTKPTRVTSKHQSHIKHEREGEGEEDEKEEEKEEEVALLGNVQQQNQHGAKNAIKSCKWLLMYCTGNESLTVDTQLLFKLHFTDLDIILCNKNMYTCM